MSQRLKFFALMLLLVTTAPALASPPFKATARLFGDSTMKGHAILQEKHNAQGPYRLDVQIEHALPFQTLDVTVNGSIIGQIITNPGGTGRLRLLHLTQPVVSGDTIGVGSMSGVFFVRGTSATQRYDLRGREINATGMRADVRYREHFRGGQLDRRFEVRLTHAEPGQGVPIFVRGEFIGVLFPDADGFAKFRMRTPATLEPDEGGPWQPLPPEFPSLAEGEQVQVGTSYVTLERR
jgi:hypothetical protein